MPDLSLVIWPVVGVIAGILAGRVLSAHGFGVLMDVVVGVVGAFLGGYSAGLAGISPTNAIMQIIVALVGAVLLLAVLRSIGFGRGRVPAVID